MASYEQPNYLKNNQFVPIFNSTNFSEPNSQSTGTSVNVSDLDTRYLSKLGNDTTPYNLTINDLSITTTSYKVDRYPSTANNIIYYNGNNPVYLNVSLTLEANTKWLVSYVGTNIYLYQSSPTTVFLSTANTGDIKASLVPFSQVTMKGSGTTGLMTYFTPANQVLVTVPSVQTTYYLYACANTAPPTTTDVLYNPSMSGGFTDPDGYIVLSALRIR